MNPNPISDGVVIALVGLAVVGTMLVMKQKSPPPPPTPKRQVTCTNVEVHDWAFSRGIFVAFAPFRTDIPDPSPGTPAGPTDVAEGDPVAGVMVQAECTFYVWNGSTWVVDPERTADFRGFGGARGST